MNTKITYDKKKLYELVVRQVSKRKDLIGGAAERTRKDCEEAPGPMQSRYDSSREELGALADGLNLRAEDIERGSIKLSLLREPINLNLDHVQIGSLVRVSEKGSNSSEDFFVLPYGGGEIVEIKGEEVIIITEDSPIYQAMRSKQKRSCFQIRRPDSKIVNYEILDIK